MVAKSLAIILLLVSTACFAHAEVLAESGYPMKAANPQRNHQITKKLLCPEIAPGRTQVWNLAWGSQLPTSDWDFTGKVGLTQDNEGSLYLGGSRNNVARYLKINSADGSYNEDLTYVSTFSIYAEPTHVKGPRMYIASEVKTVVINTTNMQEIALLNHDVPNPVSGSYAPYYNDLMITSRYGTNSIDVFLYLNTTSFEFNLDLQNLGVLYAYDVILHKNANNIEFPIVVSGGEDIPLSVLSPYYQFGIGNYLYVDSYVQNNQLVIQCRLQASAVITYLFYDASTGDLIKNVTRSSVAGKTIVESDVSKVFGDKAIGGVWVDEDNTQAKIVDVLNDKVLVEDRVLHFTPLYSIPDNSVFLFAQENNDPIELISIDWDTEAINAIGSFPTDFYYGDIIMAPPLVGDDCTVYSYNDDTRLYQKVLFAFKPLPISNVVPIVECINADGVGYFSYNNLEDKRVIIPYVADRNNLQPMSIAPATDFRAQQRGKHFPLSSRATLTNTTSSFTWQLEDYELSFTNTQQLRCPANVTIVLYFTSTSAVSANFSEWTRLVFVEYTLISEARVSVLTNNTSAANFTIVLHIATENSGSESTPEKAAQDFAGRVSFFNDKIIVDATYSTAGITLIDVDGVPLDTEISGTIPPRAQPIGQPTSNGTPEGQAPNNNNAPKVGSTSNGVALFISNIIIAIGVVVSLML